jgi:predicted Rossmann-fold nucleotide-binding protein
VQTGKVTRFPVVLMGESYWRGLLEWMRGTLVPDGKIGEADLDLVCVTDDVDAAIRYIVDADAALAAEQEALHEAAVVRQGGDT